MKKLFRITALVLLSLTVVLTFVSCGGSSSVANSSGECGAGVTWSYDSETEVLSIAGNGAMKDYASSSEVPWAAARNLFKTVTVSDGVTHIGDYAFYSSDKLEKVNLPETVQSVGKYAFAYSAALTAAKLPDSLLTIGEGAFEGCSVLEASNVPAGVTSFGKRAFAYCYSMKNTAVLANIALPEEAYLNCRSLEHITLNPAITEISDTAFKGASKTAADAVRSETTSAKITVKYVDTDGNEISESVVKENIAFGGSYSVVSPTIEGYTADKLTVSGTLYGADETQTVTYTKDAPKETAPVPSETDTAADNDEGITPSTIIAVVVLGLVLAGIGVGAFLFARSEKNNANKSTTVRKNNDSKKRR